MSSSSTPPSLRIVGLMSGTSADGVDAASLLVSGSGRETHITLERFLTVPYSSDVRESVLDMSRGYASIPDLARWHFRLGEIFADAALAVLEGLPADIIGSHGQTVAHLPTDEARRASLQIAAPAILAERTGATVVSDFRAADIAAGGEGAPLVSFVDKLMLTHPDRSRVVLNIGGIATITYLPAGSSGRAPVAFDTGPGNAPIDRAAYHLTQERLPYDAGGAVAGRGTVVQDLLDRLLQHPFLQRLPPKSTGLEDFGDLFADQVITEGLERGLKPEDVLATITRFSAVSIARGVRMVPSVDEIVVSGGGLHNATLMRFLRADLGSIPVVPSESLGFPVDAKEAMAFAILANQTIHGLPATVPTFTGARHSAVLGSITPGSNFGELMRKLWASAAPQALRNAGTDDVISG